MAKSGLEGIVVAETELSMVNGERGELWLRGAHVGELSSRVESVVEHFGVSDDSGTPGQALGEARVRAFQRGVVRGGEPIETLRATLAAMPSDSSAIDVISTMGFAMAASANDEPLAPDPALDHASDLLRMLRRRPTTEPEARALGGYLATVVDHGMNASTFAARVVASTGSDRVSAITAALGALKGPLHGGAPGPVLDMLEAIGSSENARAFLARELAEGRRIMGMGHRVYRVRDPRAAVLERVLVELDPKSPRLALARAVEEEAQALLAERYPGRSLRANVEFYTALLLDALGIDRDLFTCVFACGRVIGWCAHFEEQQREGRLIRPRATYVGRVPEAPAPRPPRSSNG